MPVTELVPIAKMPKQFRITILKELGYNSSGIFVCDKNGNIVKDRYTGDPIKISNMVIFPGSTIILDNNPVSISSFLEEFPDVI